MKKSLLSIILCFSINIVFAQDLIYTVSGELNENKTALDSILVENLTNSTKILFGDLPPQEYYQINLTKNAYWGTVGINDFEKAPAFVVAANSPGMLTINYMENIPIDIRLSVYTISGQRVYLSERKMLNARNSINVKLSNAGVFFVRIEAPGFTQTFKAIGADNVTEHSIEIVDHINARVTTKSGTFVYDTAFSFTPGDSIRISVYKNEYYTRPIGKNISASENINFLFEVSSTVTDSVSDAYVALSETTTDVTAFDTLTGAVQITYTGDNPDLKPGDIIVVDVDTMGYLRKVVETTEKDGSVTVKTEQADLTDIFVDKDFKLHTGLMNPGVQLKSTSSLEEISKALTDDKGYIHPVEVIYVGDNGKIITKSALTGFGESDAIIPIIDFYRDLRMDLYGEEGDNIHFYVDEGHVSLTSDAVFEFDFDYKGELTEDTKVKKGDIKSFSFYLDSHAEFLTKLALDMSKSYEKEKTKKLIDLKKITAKFLIGPVPFWVTFDVDVFGNYHIKADAKLHADWGFESNHDLKIGGTYNRKTKEFTPIKEYTPENTVFPLNITGEINASARFEVYPRAEIKFYSFFGPYAEIVPYVEGKYNAAMQSQTTASGTKAFLAWNSGIDLGLDFRLGIELSCFGLSKEFAPTVLNGPVWPLWQSPTAITLETTLPTETNTGTKLPLKFKVTDLLELPVPICPIYITGDCTFSKQIFFTNASGEATVEWTVSTAGKNQFTATIYKADKTIIKEITHSVDVGVQQTKATVTTIAATNITANGATLNGNVTADGNATIVSRGFYYSKTDNTPDAGDSKVTATGTTGAFSKVITVLDANATYYYRAFAKNNKGTASGGVRSFKTGNNETHTNLLEGIVSYWKFDGNLNDSHGSNNGTEASGVTSLTDEGIINYSPYFNRSSSAYITCGNDQSLNITGTSISMSAWVYNENTSGLADIISKGRDYTSNKGYHLRWYCNPQKLVAIYRLSNGENNSVDITGLENNKWYHIVSTFDGQYGKLYVNGELVNTTDKKGSIGSATTQFTMGAHSAGPSGWGYQWKGNIDEVGIWNKVVNSDEIKALYNNGSGLQYPFE